MWIFTKDGFFSAVEKECSSQELMVRSRTREDSENLCLALGMDKSSIQESMQSDYQFRVCVDRKKFAEYLSNSAMDIHYDNFKSSIHKAISPERYHAYLEVWSALYRLQQTEKRLSRSAEELDMFDTFGYCSAVSKKRKKR